MIKKKDKMANIRKDNDNIDNDTKISTLPDSPIFQSKRYNTNAKNNK